MTDTHRGANKSTSVQDAKKGGKETKGSGHTGLKNETCKCPSMLTYPRPALHLFSKQRPSQTTVRASAR